MADLSWMDTGTSDPRKIASQNSRYNLYTGQGLMDQAGANSIQQGQQADQTQSRLNDWMSPLASGQGGYNSSELSQIQMTPQQQADMVKKAGISAGVNTAASVGAAQRAAAAAGGNPLAMAAYRARAAQQQGAQAGDAMTGARVAASDAGATRAENIGQARIGQQNTGLGYYSGLQSQQNTNSQNALNRQYQTYGTAAGANNSAAQLGLAASQDPTTFDKIMGGVSGALGSLEDGDFVPNRDYSQAEVTRPLYRSKKLSPTVPHLEDGMQAVVGENGPEKVVSTKREYMADGGVPSLFDHVPTPQQPDLGTTTTNADGSLTYVPGADSVSLPSQQSPGGFKGFYSRAKGMLTGQTPAPQMAAAPGQAGSKAWSPVDTYKGIGQAAGGIAKLAGLAGFLEDGDVVPEQGANGIFTQPTRVNLKPGEAVVPLTYRSTAKVRPSKASLPAAPVTYRGGVNGRA